jgi:hypothetical protein
VTIENRHAAVNPTLYLPGDPRTTQYVEKCWRLANASAGLAPHLRPTQMYLSAQDYGGLIAELRAQHDAPEHETPGYLIFGRRPTFKVINAGTDDEAEVNRLNRDTPGAIDFEQRIKQFTQ